MRRPPVRHLCRRAAKRGVASRGCRGLTLVEVLLAASLGAVLLAGAWGWAWSVAAAGTDVGDAAEARTSLAYARRMLLADLRDADGLDELGVCSAEAIAVRVGPARHPSGIVSIVWNRERGVLWRVAPACHLADGVERFHVRYLDATGARVGDGHVRLLPAEIEAVAAVEVSLRVRYGTACAEGSWPVWLGSARW